MCFFDRSTRILSEKDDIYQYWLKKGKWYYSLKYRTLAKRLTFIDNQWNYFNAKNEQVDDNQSRFIPTNSLNLLNVTKERSLFPSIMLAQSSLESIYGTSGLAKNVNNFFK